MKYKLAILALVILCVMECFYLYHKQEVQTRIENERDRSWQAMNDVIACTKLYPLPDLSLYSDKCGALCRLFGGNSITPHNPHRDDCDTLYVALMVARNGQAVKACELYRGLIQKDLGIGPTASAVLEESCIKR